MPNAQGHGQAQGADSVSRSSALRAGFFPIAWGEGSLLCILGQWSFCSLEVLAAGLCPGPLGDLLETCSATPRAAVLLAPSGQDQLLKHLAAHRMHRPHHRTTSPVSTVPQAERASPRKCLQKGFLSPPPCLSISWSPWPAGQGVFQQPVLVRVGVGAVAGVPGPSFLHTHRLTLLAQETRGSGSSLDPGLHCLSSLGLGKSSASCSRLSGCRMKCANDMVLEGGQWELQSHAQNSQARPPNIRNWEFQSAQADLESAEEPEIKH